MSLKLTKKQQENLSMALYDVGKLSFAALVLGSFITDRPFSPLVCREIK